MRQHTHSSSPNCGLFRARRYTPPVRGSWWSRSRGTIRVAVSLERLQANIIRTALAANRVPVGVPWGAGVGAGGVARAAQQEAKGEEAVPPAELSCKVG